MNLVFLIKIVKAKLKYKFLICEKQTVYEGNTGKYLMPTQYWDSQICGGIYRYNTWFITRVLTKTY